MNSSEGNSQTLQSLGTVRKVANAGCQVTLIEKPNNETTTLEVKRLTEDNTALKNQLKEMADKLEEQRIVKDQEAVDILSKYQEAV